MSNKIDEMRNRMQIFFRDYVKNHNINLTSDQVDALDDVIKMLREFSIGDAREFITDQNEEVGIVIWQRDDVKDQLEADGYDPTDENVDIVLNSNGSDGELPNLSDCKDQDWEYISCCIDLSSKYLTKASASRKERCQDCMALVGGKHGEWICDECEKLCVEVEDCPEGLEVEA